MNRKEFLQEAEKCICGSKERDYQTPEKNFGTIAKLWSAYSGRTYTAHDVAIYQTLLKIGRIATGATKEDNYIDLMGYAGCAGEIMTNIDDPEKDDYLAEKNHNILIGSEL